MDFDLSTSQNQRAIGKPEGHSLLQMMTVILLILIVASISVPAYQTVRVRAREAVLRPSTLLRAPSGKPRGDTLFTMRSMIDRFTLDNRRPPESLDELVSASYLGRIPVDPFTGSPETWQVENETEPLAPGQLMTGIVASSPQGRLPHFARNDIGRLCHPL